MEDGKAGQDRGNGHGVGVVGRRASVDLVPDVPPLLLFLSMAPEKEKNMQTCVVLADNDTVLCPC